MDMFPTTIASLGATIEGDRLGLGTNLFSGEQTLAEKLTFDQLNDDLSQKSKFFEKMEEQVTSIWTKTDEGLEVLYRRRRPMGQKANGFP